MLWLWEIRSFSDPPNKSASNHSAEDSFAHEVASPNSVSHPAAPPQSTPSSPVKAPRAGDTEVGGEGGLSKSQPPEDSGPWIRVERRKPRPRQSPSSREAPLSSRALSSFDLESSKRHPQDARMVERDSGTNFSTTHPSPNKDIVLFTAGTGPRGQQMRAPASFSNSNSLQGRSSASMGRGARGRGSRSLLPPSKSSPP